MKTKHLILCAVLVVTAITACKKDYPSDIPEWLKDKIVSYEKKRYCKRQDTKQFAPNVSEWFIKKDSTIIYNIHKYGEYNDYYNYDGSLACGYNWPGGSAGCNTLTQSIAFKRLIWHCN